MRVCWHSVLAIVCAGWMMTVANAQEAAPAEAADVDQAFARALQDDPVTLPTPAAPAAESTAVADAAPDARSDEERSVPTAVRSSSALTLETTSVSGNRELPKVMVIVPWKNAQPVELGGRPLSSLVEEALTPIDREVFQRELDYYGLLHGEQPDDAQ